MFDKLPTERGRWSVGGLVSSHHHRWGTKKHQSQCKPAVSVSNDRDDNGEAALTFSLGGNVVKWCMGNGRMTSRYVSHLVPLLVRAHARSSAGVGGNGQQCALWPSE